MPSRSLPPSSPPVLAAPAAHAPDVFDNHHARTTPVLRPLAAAAAGFSLLIMLAACFRKFSRKRTAPSESKPPLRFFYSDLRRSTGAFSPSNKLGQGGFGSVFKGSLGGDAAKIVAVKVMDSGSLQGEREFQNELFFASKLDSPSVVSVIGFSHDRKRRRMLLVYDLMENGNLQDALLHRRCPELMDWKRRFLVAVDIAKGMEYLHSLDPAVIHGDIKPSNILLDKFFSAKIADFGLARLKSDDQNQVEVAVASENGGLKLEGNGAGSGAAEDHGSVVEEIESVITTTTGFEEFSCGGADQSPESVAKVPCSSPETAVVSASPEMADKESVLEGNFEKSSVDGEKEPANGVKLSDGKAIKSAPPRDWWWKQDTAAGEKGKVKDYVMEWIGSEVKKERPNTSWIAAASSSGNGKKLDKKKHGSKKLEWWISLDEEKEKKWRKRRPVREWWKEEYCEELVRKKEKKKKKKMNGEAEMYGDDSSVDQWWPRDEALYAEKKKKKKSRRGSSNSFSSVDWWLDGLSGDLWRARRNSHDSVSGDIAKSCGISSTPSMRGTVCYAAPEYGNCEELSEKSDVYSYGVLLLVLLAGRRPLEVTGSALEIQRANLMSWARYLARKGKLLDLVDKRVVSLDQEQALLCIKVALLCLQKSPALRPSMKEVVGMLTGDMVPPQLPSEFSPSPPSRVPFKSRNKGR